MLLWNIYFNEQQLTFWSTSAFSKVHFEIFWVLFLYVWQLTILFMSFILLFYVFYIVKFIGVCVYFPQLNWKFLRSKDYFYYSISYSIQYIVDSQQIFTKSQLVKTTLNLFHIVTNFTFCLLFLRQNIMLGVYWTLKEL